jgi:signal transduction histidine kinase
MDGKPLSAGATRLEAPATAASDGAPAFAAGARPGRLHWPVALGFLALYVGADVATEWFPHPRFGVQPWNLHPALAMALIAQGRSGCVPLVLLAVVAGWLLEPGTTLDPVRLLCALGAAGACWAGGAALRRLTRWGSGGVRLGDVNTFLGVSLAAALLCAGFGAASQFGTPGLSAANLPVLFWRLFVADLLGIVVWTPLLVQGLGGALTPAGNGARPWPLARDAAAFAILLAGLLWVAFGVQPLDQFRMSYLLFLPMIAVAMRYGLPGVVATVPVVQLGLLGALATVGIRPGTAFEFQLLTLTLAIMALFLGTLHDERRRAAARIAQNERALRERGHALDEAQRIAATAELAAAMAHDLSQPLSAIGTYARAGRMLADAGEAEHAKLIETLEEINGETARAGQYLRRMREFFRTGTMRTERVAVESLFESTHAHLRDRLVLAQVSWHTAIEPGLPPLRVDAVQTLAILGNLVGNACDALAEGAAFREVRLRAQRAPDPAMVRITVEDTGWGIPAERRGQLFKPLATSKPNGMGLGLALSRSIAERQGGRLWFEADRQLTTFCLELPCDEAGGPDGA